MNEEREGLSKKEMNNKKEDAKEKKHNREARRKRTWRVRPHALGVLFTDFFGT